MAYTGKNFLDLTGLTKYDELIKQYIDTEDAKAIKYAKVSEDGNNLLLYKSKTADASTSEASADFTIPMGSAQLESELQSLGSAVGADFDSTNKEFSVTFTGAGITSETDVVSAVDAVADEIGTLGSLTTTDKSDLVSAINEVDGAIKDLDVTEFPLAEVSSNVVTIHGISQTDGEIAVGVSAANDIVLEEVAYTGAAADVSTTVITDGAAENPTTLYPAATVQDTLQSIARDLDDLQSESVVTVEKQTTAESGYAATYVVKQNDTQVGVKINIPLDFLVKAATVEVVTTADTPYAGAAVGDKYIDFEINVKTGTATSEHLYIPVNDLVHPLSGGTTTVANEYELQVTVSATNEITTTLNNIYAKKVQFVPTSSTTKLTNVTTVEGALNAIDTLIQGMDADVDATATGSTDAAGNSPVAVVTGITEADGIITGVDSADADPFGAAIGAYNAIGSIANTDIQALFQTT